MTVRSKILNTLDKILLGILLVFLMFHYAGFVSESIDRDILIIVSIIATIPVVFSAIAALHLRRFTVDLLASIALIASLLGRQWSSAAFINLMLTSARIFAFYTDSKARAAIQSLFKLRPQKVKISRKGRIIEVPISHLKVGETIVIETGERIPIDGIITQGEASIDQSSLTGESVPLIKRKGEKVFSSTLNTTGSLLVRVEKIGKDTALEKIIDLVEQSQKGKGKIHTIAEKFATWYVVFTLFAAFIVYLIFQDTLLLLALLLVACADDVAVAVPMAFLSAIGYAARRGVIIKGGNYLEGITRVKTSIVDKTGTITLGKLSVQEVVPFSRYSAKNVLQTAVMAEIYSEHPIAKAIVEQAKNQQIKIEKVTNFSETPGKGIIGTYRNKTVITGNLTLFHQLGVEIKKDQMDRIIKAEKEGLNVTLVGINKKLIGFIASADQIRPKIKEIILDLKHLGVKKWIMLTGDNDRAAKRVAENVGIDEYHANLLPQDKLNFIKEKIDNKSLVMMMGDGVNDAASLAIADVGVAMGAIGSDTAIEASDIALMKDDFSEMPEMIRLGRYTLKVAKQDFWIWGMANVVGLVLVFSRIIGPEGAAAYNFVTDFLPLFNSLRLFNMHLKLR